jgi:hypothetical protein
MDRLSHSLIHLFGREERDHLHADHASSSYGQRDGGRSRVVRHVKDDITESIAWITVSLPLALPDSDKEYPEGTEVWFISSDAAIKPLEWEQGLIQWLKSQGH